MIAAVVIVALLAGGTYLLTRPATFSDARDVMVAISDGGLPCREQVIFDTKDRGLYSGRCYVTSEPYEVDVYVFGDTESRDRWLESLASVYDHEILVGENWFLTTGHSPITSRIQDIIGGRVRPPAKSGGAGS